MSLKRALPLSALMAAMLLIAAAIGPDASAQTSGKRSLPAIKTRAEFDGLARIYHSGTPYVLPHMMFVIDRRDKNKIYYVNSKRYTFHKDFVNGTYLSLERGEEFFQNNYINANRRFIMGTIAFQTTVKRWTFEFWEGDLIPSELIKLAFDVINKTFFTPVAYKPNSLRPGCSGGRGPAGQRKSRSTSRIGTSLILASRRCIRPSGLNSHCSLP